MDTHMHSSKYDTHVCTHKSVHAVHVYVHTYRHIQTYSHTHMHAHIHAHMHACTKMKHRYLYTFIRLFVHNFFFAMHIHPSRTHCCRPKRTHSTDISPPCPVDLRTKLELKNRLVAYVFLVDAEKRVRWRGCGYALDHEIKAMSVAAASLAHVRTGGKPRR